MIFADFASLSTPRLVLRRLEAGDAERFFIHLSSSLPVTRYMLWQPHRELTEAAASIEKALRRYEEGGFYRWAITLKDTDALIGIIDLLKFEESQSRCSFAYMLGEDYWGNGYGTEAVSAVFRFAFEQMQMGEIIADHFAENAASGAVMRKAGMWLRGRIPGKYEKDGRRHDAMEYAVTREQWMKMQGQL